MSATATALWTQGQSVETTEATDEELVAQAKKGDAAAFSELARRRQRMTYNVAYRFMRDATQAEDMAQEALLKAYRLLGGFRGDSSFSTWLYRVTASVCLTELSKRKKRGEVGLEPKHMKNQAEKPAVVDEDIAEMVRRSVHKLPEKYATIVTLYYLQGVSYDEIAKAMDIPMGTLKTWMHRARKQLRDIVEEELEVNDAALG